MQIDGSIGSVAVPASFIEHAAERFRLLSDPSRLRLLNALDGSDELAVGELADAAGVSVSTTSRHLHQLERAGIVARRRQGTTIYYRVADPLLRQLCDLVCASVSARVTGLAERL